MDSPQWATVNQSVGTHAGPITKVHGLQQGVRAEESLVEEWDSEIVGMKGEDFSECH